MGDTVWPPGTLSCRLPLPTATLDRVYSCVYGDDEILSGLMARPSVGKEVMVEKSKVCEWVKLPAPSTIHTHPSLLGSSEFPDTAGPLVWGCGVAEGCGDGEADAEEPQLPKVD